MMRFRPIWIACALLTIAIALLVLAHSTTAHAEVERSEPAVNATVPEAPTTVVIYFSQEVSSDGTVIRVLDPSGKQVDLSDTALDLYDASRKRVTVSLPADLAPGQYTVEWTSNSTEDGEIANGIFTFVIAGNATPSVSPVASPIASPEIQASATLSS
jgi:copper transport protein